MQTIGFGQSPRSAHKIADLDQPELPPSHLDFAARRRGQSATPRSGRIPAASSAAVRGNFPGADPAAERDHEPVTISGAVPAIRTTSARGSHSAAATLQSRSDPLGRCRVFAAGRL